MRRRTRWWRKKRISAKLHIYIHTHSIRIYGIIRIHRLYKILDKYYTLASRLEKSNHKWQVTTAAAESSSKNKTQHIQLNEIEITIIIMVVIIIVVVRALSRSVGCVCVCVYARLRFIQSFIIFSVHSANATNTNYCHIYTWGHLVLAAMVGQTTERTSDRAEWMSERTGRSFVRSFGRFQWYRDIYVYERTMYHLAAFVLPLNSLFVRSLALSHCCPPVGWAFFFFFRSSCEYSQKSKWKFRCTRVHAQWRVKKKKRNLRCA